jgi:hypothetical protein
MKQILALILAFISFDLFASDPVKEALLKSGDASKYPSDNLLVVFDSTQVVVKESGLTYVTGHSLTKVLTSKGAMDLDVVKFGYDPLSAYIRIDQVTIYKADGTVIALDTASVQDYPAPARAIYWGAREKMISIGHLEPGDAVEVFMFRKGFTYALLQDEDDRYIPPMKGNFYDIVEFFGPNPIVEKVYQVTIPKDKLLQFRFYNGEAEVSALKDGDNMQYSFTKRDILHQKPEPRVVAQSDVAPKLLLSTSPDWFAKSTWFFNVNEDFGSFETTPEITAKVNEILKGAKTEMDTVSLLTHWCADEIRYSGISMGEGEGFTLHRGEMTFNDRCGVCKDKAGMLITMLRAAGMKSYPAMTMAGSRIDYIPADQFNHCVTVVRLKDGKYHLLDPTWVPFTRELWSSAEQQQQYLMGVPEGADLGTTPISAPENHYIKITGNSILSPEGTLTGTVEITAEGQSDATVRGLFKYSRPSLWKTNVEKELIKIHPKAHVTKIEFSDPIAYKEGPVTVKISYMIPEYAIVSGNTIIFTPITVAPVFKSYQGQLSFDTGLKERQYPFRDRCSRLVEISETVTLPRIRNVVCLPSAEKQDGKAASFNGGYELKGNTLSFSGTARFGKRVYEASEWPEFRSAVDGQNKFADEPVIFNMSN